MPTGRPRAWLLAALLALASSPAWPRASLAQPPLRETGAGVARPPVATRLAAPSSRPAAPSAARDEPRHRGHRLYLAAWALAGAGGGGAAGVRWGSRRDRAIEDNMLPVHATVGGVVGVLLGAGTGALLGDVFWHVGERLGRR